MSMRIGAFYVARDSKTGTPVLIVEGGKLASHGGRGSWLSAKVDSKLPGPIACLYTGDVKLMPSTADTGGRGGSYLAGTL